MVDHTLAHYKILQRIGAGGMGEVYLAEDTTLNRQVALKVLPPELADSEDRRERFAREAKALAALNHPNIVTVHSVEVDDGIHFITMELVKGKTLAELLPRQGFPLDRFFDIAVPLADAVAAAHEHRIVHRDLKPGNVMVTDDGRIKVLDFGLAKATGGLDGTSGANDLPTIAKTAQGVIVGTWNYMSPEQARGEHVDARSDIFSLGIIFYEMLTGRRPFAGDTPAEALSSIIRDVPPLVSEIRSGIPRELSRIVRRCLVKDLMRRAQNAADIRNEMVELKRELDSGELLADVRPSRKTRSGLSKAVWATAAAVGLVTLGRLSVWMWTAPPDAKGPRLQNSIQVTSAAGVENQATWSPDGGRIAYVSDQSGDEDIWVTQLAGGSAANFTDGHAGFDRDPAWSPDGTLIAFQSERDGVGIFVMPAIGGSPIRIASRGSSETISSPAWSADGTELAFLRREEAGGVIEIVSLRTQESRRIGIPGDSGNRFDLSWSPDGRFFAFVRAASRDDGATTVWVLRASDARGFAVTDGMSAGWSPIWSSDPRTLFYLSNRGGSMDLWRQQLSADGMPEGDPVALTVGVGMQHAAFSRDGRKLVYSKDQAVANVWRVPILENREATWLDAESLTRDQANVTTLDLFPDGERLVISSNRGGNVDLWKVMIDSRQMTQLTSDPSPDLAPRVSPDGQRIAFHSYRSGNRDIWTIPADGGPAVQVTQDDGTDMFPAWSADSSELTFYSGRTGFTNAFVVPATGGEARRIFNARTAIYMPQASPDGAWIVYVSRQRLWRIPAAGGTEEKLTDVPTGFFRWSGNEGIYFVEAADGKGGDLWTLTLATRVTRRVTRFSGQPGGVGPNSLAVGPRHLYYTWSSNLGDIWVTDVVTGDKE